MGSAAPGESSSYTVNIDPPEKAVGLSYLWSVKTFRGEVGMVRGQGTTRIEVPYTYDNVTATVTVLGLPSGCSSTTSETYIGDPRPVAIKLDEFSGSPAKLPKARFESIRQKLTEDPNARLYVLISAGKGGSVSSKRSVIEKHLKATKINELIQFVASNEKDDKVVFWMVPPGADLPVQNVL